MSNCSLLLRIYLGFATILSVACVEAEPLHVGMNSVSTAQGLISYIYGEGEGRKLVVYSEKDKRRLEISLARAGFAPFIYNENVFVVDPYGYLTAYSVNTSDIHLENEVILTTNAVRAVECNRPLGIVFFIETVVSDRQKNSFVHELIYNLVAYDLANRKFLWSKTLKKPGLITAYGKVVCVVGEDEVEAFEAGDGKVVKGRIESHSPKPVLSPAREHRETESTTSQQGP
jgi:hypothetical protein